VHLGFADPTSGEISLPNLIQETTIYLIPECETDEEVADVLRALCEEIFEEQLAGWYTDTSTWPHDRSQLLEASQTSMLTRSGFGELQTAASSQRWRIVIHVLNFPGEVNLAET